MFSSTGLTSKEMVTSLNSTTGVWSPGGWTVAGPGVGMAAGMGGAQLPKIPIMARVTSRSTTMMTTEETTTAWVVARPTPWVPPVVFMPK